MAAKLTDEKLPYEVLIRFGIDGKVQGAHCQYRRRVMLGDELLKDEVGEAMPLALDDFPTSDIMTDATRSALAGLTALNEVVEKQKRDLQDAANEIAALRADVKAREKAAARAA